MNTWFFCSDKLPLFYFHWYFSTKTAAWEFSLTDQAKKTRNLATLADKKQAGNQNLVSQAPKFITDRKQVGGKMLESWIYTIDHLAKNKYNWHE